MKNALLLALSFFIFKAQADETLLGSSPYAANAVRVTERVDNGEILNRFEYCPNKRVLTTCQVLGKGWYKKTTLTSYRRGQKTLSALTATGAVIFGIAGYIGLGDAPILGLPLTGAAIWLAIQWTKHGNNLSTLKSEFLKGSDFDIVPKNRLSMLISRMNAAITPEEKQQILIMIQNMAQKYIVDFKDDLNNILQKRRASN